MADLGMSGRYQHAPVSILPPFSTAESYASTAQAAAMHYPHPSLQPSFPMHPQPVAFPHNLSYSMPASQPSDLKAEQLYFAQSAPPSISQGPRASPFDMSLYMSGAQQPPAYQMPHYQHSFEQTW